MLFEFIQILIEIIFINDKTIIKFSDYLIEENGSNFIEVTNGNNYAMNHTLLFGIDLASLFIYADTIKWWKRKCFRTITCNGSK